MPEQTSYIKQEPYVGDDAIYWPVEEYALEGCASYYRPVLTKELFIEAYNKWILKEDV
jgi:hypothetical protein